jgi:GT2 family glycosyltransferase
MGALDFLVLGAQKAGTTTLWELLRGHPQLSLPAAKEVPFFSDDDRYARGVDWYLKTFFDRVDEARLHGTATPQYMTGSSSVGVVEIAARIAATAPEVKLIALLRDPVERAISHYRMSVRRGTERRTLERAFAQQLQPAAIDAARTFPGELVPRQVRGHAWASSGYLAWGEYGRVLRAYRRNFGASQMLLLLTADLDRDPESTLVRVLNFLAVDDRWRPPDLHIRRLVGGDELRIPREELRSLVQVLEEVIPKELQGSLEARLEEWNTVPGEAAPRIPDAIQGQLRAHFAADAALLEQDWDLRVPWADAEPPSPPRAPETERPETSLIVLVHETPGEAEAILESIVRHTDGAYEILLVDNGSSAAVAATLAEFADRFGARLIRNDENLVFSVAINHAAREARADELMLLNSDVVVTPNWLATLRDSLYSAPDVAAVGPRSNYMRTRQGGIWLEDSSPQGVERFGRYFNYPDPKRRFEIDWLSGFALLVRREVFEGLGGLDEDIPWYGLEDADFGERLWDAGKRVLCAGDVFVYHTGHRTFSQTGTNRTATRLSRDSTHAPGYADDEARLVRERGLVFELRDGVASHVETGQAVALLRAGRKIEELADGELDGVPVGPPISICRARGSDEVWLLHSGVKRRLTGDQQRIRRFPGVSMAEPGELDVWPEGPAVAVEAASPPVPELQPFLPSNPAAIRPDDLLDVAAVMDRIAAALERDDPLALIRLDADEAWLLNEGMWPDELPEPERVGIRGDPSTAAAALRRAIREADLVGVSTNRRDVVAAPLLEHLLFHFDLYPRYRCDASVNMELLGFDPVSGRRIAPRGPLQQLLDDRPVALAVPAALLRSIGDGLFRSAAPRLDVRVAVPLDDMSDIEDAFTLLAAQRERYDAVLVAGQLPAKPLCVRLAHELGVVALDLGMPLGRLLHPRFGRDALALIATHWEVAEYLRQVHHPSGESRHPLDGRLVRARGEPAVYYVERGAARAVGDPRLLTPALGQPLEIEAEELARLPRGPRVCVVHERLTGPYVLLDGRKHRVSLPLPVAELDDLALAGLEDGDLVLRAGLEGHTEP